MDSETKRPERPNQTRQYTQVDKLVAMGRYAEQTGDTATLEEINTQLRTAMEEAGIRVAAQGASQKEGWEPIPQEEKARIMSMPTEEWYVDSKGRKKKARSKTIPQFPPIHKEKKAADDSLEPVNVIIDRPINLTEAQWLEQINHIPNFDGDSRKAARFMYDLASGILHVRSNKSSETSQEEYQIPAVAIYYGKNRGNFGVYYDASFNQIVVSSSHLASYSGFDETDRIILRSDIQGNEVVFDGRIRNWASLIGVEEATHAGKNQREPITSHILDRRNVKNLAEYDASDEEYEALLEQNDFAKKERMDRETIAVIELRIRNAQQVRRELGKTV